MASITPEDLAVLFKRRGHFDSTRKSLLTDFQNSVVGQQFASQLTDILQKCIDEDPNLLQREKPEFHQLMVERIIKSAAYKDVQQFVDSLLQPAQYLNKIEGTLMTIVKEQAPPEKEESVEQDKGKDQKSVRKSKDSSTVDTLSRSEAPNSSSRRNDTHGSTDKHSKQHTIVKKELSLELPPRPPSKPRDQRPRQDPATPSVKREPSPTSTLLDLPANLPRKPSTESGSKEDSGRRIIPKKRNRRQSLDSNSSLSSPPSSSEGESDADSGARAGSRAKKLAKKAPKDTKDAADGDSKSQEREHATVNGNGSIGSAGAMSGIESDTAMDVDVKAEDEDEHVGKEVSATKQDGLEGELSSMAVDQTKEKSSAPNGSTKHNSESTVESIPNKGGRKESTPDTTIKSPTAGANTSASRSSPTSSSAPSSQHNSPAPSGTGSHRRRESETAERRNSDQHSHHGSHSKRTGHQPLPLPPRPNIVPLPPKPAALSLHRRTSHSRNSSSVTVPSSGVNASTGGSAPSPSLPSIPSAGSPTALSSSSRQNSVSRDRTSQDRHDSRSGHSHLHHPLPPPPHLQHPLPPPPRGSLAGSRSQSLSSVPKCAGSTSPSSASSPTALSKPVISTSQSAIAGSPSGHATPTATTPKSVTSLASPDTAQPKNSPKAESHAGATKGDHALKSPDSNSSTGSIHSSGSLSSTGSLSTAGSVSELSMAATSPDLSSDRPSFAKPLAGTEVADSETTKEEHSATAAKIQDGESAPKSEASPATPPPPPPPESPVASSDPVPPPPPPPPSSPPPPPPSSDSAATAVTASSGAGTAGIQSASTNPSANSSPVTKSSPSLPSPVKHSPLSGASATLLSAKPKNFGRTPIPLPHKPIPLPPRPNAPTSSASSLKKKHK
ncbi:hypothetical protein BGX23_011250 [Mortierella sp. AD031]|nr:hypothetical protein BGX23_011250 [Mortierella sp. AD031]KAG0199777.1 hypothetical protein BGX33_011458 [Mortierella sp. NVP41]